MTSSLPSFVWLSGRKKRRKPLLPSFLCARRVIFPGRLQPSIVTVCELNYCVRDGNRCTLATIDTHLLSCVQESKQRLDFVCPVRKTSLALRAVAGFHHSISLVHTAFVVQPPILLVQLPAGRRHGSFFCLLFFSKKSRLYPEN